MGKGTNTTTSSSSPNPFAANAYLQLLNRAQNVADTPYQPYTGQLTADINSQQQTGIGAINQNAGFAQPYIQQAHGFATDAAAPITQQEISQYQSPYTQQVVDATSNWFNTQNQQQQQNVVGNAAAQGALGGDRVGVAQANLASQQTASQAPIIAGLYNQGYTQALGAAERQRANLGNAAYSIGNLGVAGQNAAMTGANAQLGAGNLLYGNDQDRLNRAYQQFQIQQAFPYQQAQWLAGLQTGVGSQLGGNSSTTAPAPNPFAQYAGVGLTAASMFLKDGGRIKGFSPGGGVEDGPFSGVGWIPVRQITMGQGAPKAPGAASQSQQSGLSKPTDFGARYGDMFSTAGVPMDISSGAGSFSPSGVGSVLPMGMSPEAGFGLGPLYRNGGGVRGYDVGGEVMDDLPLRFADRWAPVPEAIRAGGFDPQGANYTTGEGPMVSDAGVVPMPRSRPDTAPVAGFVPMGEDAPALGFAPEGRAGPRVMTPNGMAQPDADGVYPSDATMMPGNPLSDVPGAMPFAEARPSSGVGPPQPEQRRGFNLGLLPDNLRAPLLAAGLGMLASRSPNLGNAIGDGGLAGLGAYNQQKQSELQHAEKRETLAQGNRRLDNETKRLDQAAEDARKRLAETSRHNLATEERTLVPPGYRRGAEGNLEAVPGGPQDPKTIEAQAKAKKVGNGLLDDDTIQDMAGQYLSGDKSVMQNLGRGAQGAENIVKLRGEITRQAREAGLTPNQVATKMADFAGRTAAMRSLGTRGVNVEYAANTANRAIDLAQEASDKVPRTQFVPFNRLAQMVANNTSSPEQAAFYAATNTLVNEYARVASGGSNQATEGMRHHAREMLNTAQGPEAYKAVLGMMRREITTAKAAYNETRQEFLSDSHARDSKGAPDTPGAGAATPKIGDRKQFKQGWGVWDGTKYAPEKP